MNRRVLQVLAVAWAAGLLGTYVAYRYKQSSPSSQHIMPSSKLGKVHLTSEPYSTSMPSTDPRTFVGSKSAAVFEPADVAKDLAPETQSSGLHPLPSSKSGRAFTPPPQTGPAKRELFRSSKSGNVDLDPANILFADESPATSATSQPATAPAGPSPRSERMLLPGSKSKPLVTEGGLFSNEPVDSPTTAPADPKP